MPTQRGRFHIPHLAGSGDEPMEYLLTVICHCGARRTFLVTKEMALLSEREAGFYLSSFCEKCRSNITVQVLSARGRTHDYADLPLVCPNPSDADFHARGLVDWPVRKDCHLVKEVELDEQPDTLERALYELGQEDQDPAD